MSILLLSVQRKYHCRWTATLDSLRHVKLCRAIWNCHDSIRHAWLRDSPFQEKKFGNVRNFAANKIFNDRINVPKYSLGGISTQIFLGFPTPYTSQPSTNTVTPLPPSSQDQTATTLNHSRKADLSIKKRLGLDRFFVRSRPVQRNESEPSSCKEAIRSVKATGSSASVHNSMDSIQLNITGRASDDSIGSPVTTFDESFAHIDLSNRKSVIDELQKKIRKKASEKGRRIGPWEHVKIIAKTNLLVRSGSFQINSKAPKQDVRIRQSMVREEFLKSRAERAALNQKNRDAESTYSL